MSDWRYELTGLTAQQRLGAVKVYEAVAERLADRGAGGAARTELRSVAAAEGLDADHPWIGAAAAELERPRRTPHTPGGDSPRPSGSSGSPGPPPTEVE